MHATDVIAWTADADYWCHACAALAYGPDVDTRTDSEGNDVHPVFGSDEWPSEGITCGRCHGEIGERSCDCDTTEYLPCELHSETLAQYEGSSARSADMLACVAIGEMAYVICNAESSDQGADSDHSCLAAVLPLPDVALVERVEEEISSDPFTSWSSDPDAGQWLSEICWDLERELPPNVYAHWDDGFTLYRITGGPLLTD